MIGDASKRPQSDAVYKWLLAILVLQLTVLLALVDGPSRIVWLRTMALGGSASVLAVLLGGIGAAVCLRRGFVPRLLLVTLMALAIMPLVIHVSSWDAAFGKLGWLTESRGQVLTPLVSGWIAAIWVHGLAATPQVALIFLACAWNDRREYEEQARLETTAFQVFLSITLPRYWPVVGIAVLWVIMTCAREIAVTDLYQIETLAEQVYLGYALNHSTIVGSWSADQLTEANQLNQWLIVAALGVQALASMILFLAMTQRLGWGQTTSQTGHLGDVQVAGKWTSGIGATLWAVLVVVPLINTVARASFYVKSIEGIAQPTYDLTRIEFAVRRACQDYSDEFTWSCLIAITASTIILLVMLMVVGFTRRSRWGRLVFSALMAIGFALPGPVIGSSLAWLFSSSDNAWFHWLTDYTIFGPVVAAGLFCGPICGILIWLMVDRTSHDVLDGARLDGANEISTFWEFGVKANRLGLVGVWLIGFTLCFGELAASSMVRPAGMDTVARKMLGDLHAGVDELTAGMTIVITLVVVCISLLGWLFFWLNQAAGVRK
ncbi:MAG: ABC transporter permease subunit [Planctomycetota bacterium]